MFQFKADAVMLNTDAMVQRLGLLDDAVELFAEKSPWDSLCRSVHVSISSHLVFISEIFCRWFYGGNQKLKKIGSEKDEGKLTKKDSDV